MSEKISGFVSVCLVVAFCAIALVCVVVGFIPTVLYFLFVWENPDEQKRPSYSAHRYHAESPCGDQCYYARRADGRVEEAMAQ